MIPDFADKIDHIREQYRVIESINNDLIRLESAKDNHALTRVSVQVDSPEEKQRLIDFLRGECKRQETFLALMVLEFNHEVNP